MKNNRLIKHMVASMLLVIMTFSLCSCGSVDNKNSGGESSTTAPESTLEPVDENRTHIQPSAQLVLDSEGLYGVS